MLEIYQVSLDVIRLTQPIVREVKTKDPNLADQLRRSATSVTLNLAEGSGSRGRNRDVRYQDALGSAMEVLACNRRPPQGS